MEGDNMNVKKLMFVAIGLLLAGLLMNPTARPQVTRERREAIRARTEQLKEFFNDMPDEHKRALSGSAQNLLHMAENRMEELMREETPHPERLRGKSSTPGLSGSLPASINSKLIQVSDPSNDFAFSVQTGFTQSETSTAWCGNNVVVGFNDSGSLPESIFFGPGGASFNGVALSTRRGESFADLGFLNPGPNFFDFLAGDPVLGCANGSTFYYASLFETGTPLAPLSAISVSISSDGGAKFGNPLVAVSKDGFTHFLDKEWMAVDPTNPNRIFVTYTDFDSSGAVCGFSLGTPIPRAAIELVWSTNGAATWSAPLVIDQTCGASFMQGSQVAVGPASEVYVAWERFVGGFSGTRSLVIRKSVNHGATFGPTVKIDDATPSGDGFALEGGFRNFLTGSLAVDRSGGPTNGFVYIAWDDGRNLQVPDFGGINGFYGYADILVRRSIDGGATWSPAVRVNDNLEPLENGRGTDRYQPGVAVDKTGRVAACFYDRRNDPSNFRIDRFCAVSEDAGATWNNKRVTEKSFPPIHATDTFVNPVYMGDYDVLASDFTKQAGGFIGGFQFINSDEVFVPNPDVKATRLRVEE